MKSSPQTPSYSVDVPKTGLRGDVGGHPDTSEQAQPPDLQTTPADCDAEPQQPTSVAEESQDMKDSTQLGHGNADTASNDANDPASAPWVPYPSSPPPRPMSEAGSTRSSPSPSERAFRDGMTLTWLESQERPNGPLSLSVTPRSQCNNTNSSTTEE